jgi:hypothetical protein
MYIVPKNVIGRFEILPGFGLKELFLCGIALAIGGGLSLLISSFNVPTPVRIGFIIVPPGIMFFITQPGLMGESFFDLFKFYRLWLLNKKVFLNYYEGGGEHF